MPNTQQAISAMLFPLARNTVNDWSMREYPKQPTNSGRSYLTSVFEIRHLYSCVLDGSSSIDAIEDRFTKLAAVWEEQSTYLSSMEKQCMLAPYQEIMTMGWPVVPLILKRMEQEPDWWFWALRFITSVNPVPESAEGDLTKMTDAWLQWGRRNHLI